VAVELHYLATSRSLLIMHCVLSSSTSTYSNTSASGDGPWSPNEMRMTLVLEIQLVKQTVSSEDHICVIDVIQFLEQF